LGAGSLLATQVISILLNAFQVELPLRSLFASPTVAGIAALIEERQAVGAEDSRLDELLAELEELSDEEAEWLLREAGA
jgi:hypothetical protein